MWFEIYKFVGVLFWIFGLLALFISPILGVLLLLFAVAITVGSVSHTKERRHRELLEAMKQQPPPEREVGEGGD